MFGNNSTLSNTVIHGRTGERFQNFGSGERSQSNVNDCASIGADIGMATAEAAISAKAGGAIASTVSAAMGTAFSSCCWHRIGRSWPELLSVAELER